MTVTFWDFAAPCFAKTCGAVSGWCCGCLMKECRCYSIPHFSHSEDFRAGTGCPGSVLEHRWCGEDQLCVLAAYDLCSGWNWEMLYRGLSTLCPLLRLRGLAGSWCCQGIPFHGGGGTVREGTLGAVLEAEADVSPVYVQELLDSRNILVTGLQTPLAAGFWVRGL